MNEPIRTQWQIRCAFNGYCKRALQNEMLAAKRDIKRRQRREVTFSDLTSQEEKQLFVCDEYFADDEAEKSFVTAASKSWRIPQGSPSSLWEGVSKFHYPPRCHCARFAESGLRLRRSLSRFQYQSQAQRSGL